MPDNYNDVLREKKYVGNVELALAETPGKLSHLATQGAENSADSIKVSDEFDQLYMEEIPARNSKTVNTDPDVNRRWMSKPRRAGVAPLVDPDDKMTTSVEVKSPLVQNIALAARRYHDDQWVKGFFSPAWGGEEGKTAIPFKAANVLSADYGAQAGVYGRLTLEKLRGVRKLARKRFVDTDREKLNMVVTAEEIEDLLSLDQFINGNYANTKALENGEIRAWMGFTFHPAEIDNPRAYPKGADLAVNAQGHRRLPIWVNSGMHYNTWLEFSGHDDVRSDLNHSEQFAGYACGAATRVNEDKCFIIECAD